MSALTRAALSALALLTLGLASAALAEDGDEEPSLDLSDIMKDIDLGDGPSGSAEISYDGRLSDSAPGYKAGTPVSITHTGGTIAVRCMDAEGITARLGYTVYGTKEAPMEAFGKGIGLSTWGSETGGGVKTRIPAKTSGVNRADIPLTVNLPKKAKITVTGGSGWVQVIDCEGTVKVTNSVDGAYVSGNYGTVDVSSAKGDVKVELTDQTELVGASRLNAPGGAATLKLPLAYGGKLMAKGSSVSVFHTVAGTITDTLVQGTVGVGSASLSVTARDAVSITTP